MAKKFIRILALGLALMMCLAMAVPAIAAEGDPAVSTSGVVYFDKDLVMPNDATVPDVTFNFVLGANNRGNGILVEGWEVHTGIFNLKVEETEPTEPPVQEEEEAETELQAAYSVSFDASHPTTPGSETSEIAEEGQKYATESFSVDFSKVDWPEPGIYRYVIKETNDSVDGITYTDKVFYIDVYIVIDDTTGELTVGNTVVTEDDFLEPDPESEGATVPGDAVVDNPKLPGTEGSKSKKKLKADGTEPQNPGEAPQEPGEGVVNPEDKLPDDEYPDGDQDDPNVPSGNTEVNKGRSQADFINAYEPLTLALSKTVKGNQGSRIAFFKFTVKIEDSDLSDGVYKILVGNTGDGENSDDYIIVRDGVGEATVYLKHGQSISLLVPYGIKYTITEAATGAADEGNANAYKTSTAAEATGSSFDWTNINTTDNKTVTASDLAEGATVAFVNYKQGTIPTGVLMTIAPFAALMGVGLVGGAVVLKKKRED